MIYLYKIPNAFSFKTYLHFNNRIPLMKFIPRRSPIQIEARQGLQQYIHSKKAAPPWNGVRLYLTFLRLATLVGIGHEGTSSAQQTNYPTHHPSSATHPNRNQMPSGICSAKKRFVGRGGWGPGEGPEGVQLYIRFVKATPSRNGVRLYLTFLRLATLVGIGHEIATPWALPRVSKPCGNGILNEMENNALYSRLRFQKTINNLTCAKNKKKINHPPISP